MNTADSAGSGSALESRAGWLYPLMLIAALAVIGFSAIGTATMLGWMPGAHAGTPPATQSPEAAPLEAGRAAARCMECGRIESVRPDGVRVRMDDGSFRTFGLRAQPPLPVGQKVRVINQGLVAAG